jgi:hypothetical protein
VLEKVDNNMMQIMLLPTMLMLREIITHMSPILESIAMWSPMRRGMGILDKICMEMMNKIII